MGATRVIFGASVVLVLAASLLAAGAAGQECGGICKNIKVIGNPGPGEAFCSCKPVWRDSSYLRTETREGCAAWGSCTYAP